MNNLVKNNIVRNSRAVGLYNDNAPGNVWASNVLYVDDTLHNRDGNPMIIMAVADEGGTGPGSTGVGFRNNVIYNAPTGFRYGKFDRSLGLHSATTLGNTIVSSTLTGFTVDNAPTTSGNLIANNIISSSTGSAAYVSNPAGLDFNHNQWNGVLDYRIAGTGDIIADPQFTGGALQRSAFLRKRDHFPGGTSRPGRLRTTDFDNVIRPNPPSIGAFEATALRGQNPKPSRSPSFQIDATHCSRRDL